MGSTPPPPPPNPLDYSGHVQGVGRRRRWIDWSMAFSCVAAAAAVTAIVFVVVPRAEVVYKNWGTRLPEMTIALLKFARFCVKGGIVLVWGLFAVVPFIPPLLDEQTVEKPRRRYFSTPRLLLTLFLLVFFGWIIFALFTPYVTLINSLSGPTGKR